MAAALGWRATDVRFPVPAAENAASFHFEVEAPPDVLIASATLVAGRPRESADLSVDHVAGGLPVVGLHAVKVPNGSLSQVRVALRPSRRGWLTSAVASCLGVAALLTVMWLLHIPDPIGLDGPPEAATVILTIGAAIVAFLSKPAEHRIATRLVPVVRWLAVVAAGLLLAAGVAIGFEKRPVETLILATYVSWGCAALAIIAWATAFARTAISPWEQGIGAAYSDKKRRRRPASTVREARSSYRLDKPMALVESAEGDHREQFTWTTRLEETLHLRIEAGLCETAVPAPREWQ
jgi:hypothetical protein